MRSQAVAIGRSRHRGCSLRSEDRELELIVEEAAGSGSGTAGVALVLSVFEELLLQLAKDTADRWDKA